MDEHLPEALRAVEDELAALLRRGRALSWEIAREVHPNLEPNAYGLLLWLRRSGSTRLTDLATRLGIGKGTLSRQIHGLEGLGLVRRDPDPDDRRAAQLSLTEEGTRRFDSARSVRLGQLRQALESWPDRDVEEFARLLRRFNDGAL
ncbi:MarR family winged helix-turn-helix transcriptional regulator [Micromonospora halophytica]|uniref:DNA-binding transcriptional regulator, MarR family n=1 Tax=Micromonospora halophytica TaxID=47864 RepID=A0A1C5IH65_9ACTN|nr:MarR family transcriptional regulator [Micromonospora halophytica]SCG57752.1 DNA-binding transcriptional regulator, MarR family [Micromonospora halophytica]